VKNLNGKLKNLRFENYLKILAGVVLQWERLSGDTRPSGYLRGKHYRSFFSYADALVSQKYETAALHFAAHQLSALVRKYPWDPALIGTDPEGKAIETFAKAEHRCKRQNQWFLARRRTFDCTWEPYLARMRAYLEYVFGCKPDLHRIYELADYTGGASIGVNGNATHIGAKLSAPKWTVSPSAYPYFHCAVQHHFSYSHRVSGSFWNPVAEEYEGDIVAHIDPEEGRMWFRNAVSEAAFRSHVEVVQHNKVAFVPKTAKTFRSIAVEPMGNGFIQKGTDLYMRQNLKRVGVDLSDQTLNQRLAYYGSLDDSDEGFVTIDLESASDSVSIELCREVLPPDWFNFLNRIRSPSYKLGDSIKRYHKFCSMGNGFCFPLETALFLSVIKAVDPAAKAGKDFAVYGDDIIVRKKISERVLSLLRRIGFRPNVRKTLLDGPFRESCGSNWYGGEDVTPFTLDFELDCLSSLFKFVNLCRRNLNTTRFLSDWVIFVLNMIPHRLQFHRPFAGPPDSGIDPIDIDLPYHNRYSYHRRWQCPRWLELDVRPAKDLRQMPAWVVNAAALRGHPSECMFTFRRKTVTRVRVIARSGAINASDPPKRVGYSHSSTYSLRFIT